MCVGSWVLMCVSGCVGIGGWYMHVVCVFYISVLVVCVLVCWYKSISVFRSVCIGVLGVCVLVWFRKCVYWCVRRIGVCVLVCTGCVRGCVCVELYDWGIGWGLRMGV